MTKYTTFRSLIHYLLAAIIVPIYGIQVCPFIESLSPIQVVVPVVVALSLQLVLRNVLAGRLIDSAPLEKQTKRTFTLEILLFIASALGLMVFNTIAHGFPLTSGLKVFVGIFGLGFFAAIDIALERERHVGKIIEQSKQYLDPQKIYFPLSQKVALFATISVVMLIAIFMLLVIKDLDWIVEVGKTIPLHDARISIIKEFMFVLAVILPHTLNVISSYSKNLNLFLAHQTSALTNVADGKLDTDVPVSTFDEFGIMAKHTNTMIAQLKNYIDEISLTRDVTILSLASLAEARDNETGQHILRTQRYVRALALRLRPHPSFADALNDEAIDLLYKSAPLHDIGKVGIPDNILLKPGKHTDEEFELMKTHAQIGGDALKVAENKLGTTSFLRLAREIAETHHEKWDGSGYPNGLRGNEIPISGRLMAVADVYDALISKRVYKPAFSHEKAMEIIREGAGKHFDPDIVAALNDIEEEFKEIAKAFSDSHH